MLQIPKDITGGGETQFALLIHAPLQDVWRMFTDIERWPEYSNLYQLMRWTSRERWTVGSHFEGRLQWPIPLTVRHVIMNCRPKQEIRWLAHGIGIVIERWTHFQAKGEFTEITTSAIYVGKSTKKLPGEVGELLPKYTERLYNDFKLALERSIPRAS
jgi:hypothetical protein